jgi:phospholipid/cholesterol/gamma-HCH transport system ATP-binding protein
MECHENTYLSFTGYTPAMITEKTILQIEHVHVHFGAHAVLRDLHFGIRKGETVAIIGESGCGKTVLLKTLIGLVSPIRGRVLFDGNDLGSLSNKEITRQRTRYGFVFQQAALFDSMSIRENVSFPIIQHMKQGYLDDELLEKNVKKLLAEVGLPASVLEKKPAELSGGMRKRVGFARALAMEPEVILYDEPTTGLDPIMGDVINELMLRVKRKHEITGIMVTHDMESARKVADRIIMLYPLSRLDGEEPQILFDGTPDEIEHAEDSRVTQFVNGEAGERLMEMCRQEGEDSPGDDFPVDSYFFQKARTKDERGFAASLKKLRRGRKNRRKQ